jgi:hypothetical protein
VCLQHLPMEDGAPGLAPLHLLRRSGRGGGHGEGPEEVQDVANKGDKSVERARELVGSHLRKVAEADKIQRHVVVPDLELPHFCRHDGSPGES